MQLKENQLFHDRYLLIRLLGRGGYSEVWLVEDRKTGLEMALKIYAPGTGLDEDGIAIFVKEFALVFNLNHSNLLKPAYLDDMENMPYLILPYCQFGSTTKLIGQMDETTVWQFLHDVASGLAYLHAQAPPVIHQDIKPDNILMDDTRNFLITDFGISTKVRHTLRKSLSHHLSGNGTRAYMGPERFSREPMAIKASDIWALGATVYELLEGDAPFGVHGGVVQRSGAEIPDIRGDWSTELRTIVQLCLQLEPWDRPTAEKIVEWTEEHRNGRPCHFSGSLSMAKPVRPTIRIGKKRLKTTLGVVAAALIAVLVWIFAANHLIPDNKGMEVVDDKYRKLVADGDDLSQKGESSYKQALETYQEAQQYALSKHFADTTYLVGQRTALTRKIDSLVQAYNNDVDVMMGLGHIPLAIENLEKSLALKDDPVGARKLTDLKK